MKLIVVSGRSGSGKTIALRVLEDLGYYCVDNLPVALLSQLVQELRGKYDNIAVSIDVRNIPEHGEEIERLLGQIRQASDIQNTFPAVQFLSLASGLTRVCSLNNLARNRLGITRILFTFFKASKALFCRGG